MPNYKFYFNKQFFINVLISGTFMVSPFAMAENWQWQLSAGQIEQDYVETEATGLTPNGVLNSEKGRLPVIELSVINTTDPILILNNHLKPYGKLQFRLAKGDTDYDGYLQTGATLTPYRTHTDNTLTQVDFDLGLGYEVNPNLTLTPLITVSHQRWERELEQYTEDFHHTELLTGANIDWQPNREVPFTLQFQAKAGKIIDSHIDVPKLGLNQDIGNANVTQLGLTAQYLLTEQINIQAGIKQKKFKYEQSNTENGYQYPDSKSKQTLLTVGLGYHF